MKSKHVCAALYFELPETWLGNLILSSSLRTYLKRSFFLAKVVRELLNIFLSFSWTLHVLVTLTENWKHALVTPLVPFNILPTMFIERPLQMICCKLKYIYLNTGVLLKNHVICCNVSKMNTKINHKEGACTWVLLETIWVWPNVVPAVFCSLRFISARAS